MPLQDYRFAFLIYGCSRLKYDYSIMDVTKKVQEKVKNAVENMTGLEVADVNIKVAGVEMEKQN